MQISIPIIQLANEPSSPGKKVTHDIWDRKHDLGVYSALDFWGRHEYYVDVHHPERHVDIPRAVQLGHGDMHLNSWFAPDELIDRDDGDGGNGNPTFEVKVNVADFKPEELKVKLNEEERLLTIEGQHHEHHEHHEPNDHALTTQHDSVRLHFKRSVTLPPHVLTNKLECSLSPDGGHLVLTAPVKSLHSLSPAETARSRRRRCEKGGKCANLTKCQCEFDAEDKRG